MPLTVEDRLDPVSAVAIERRFPESYAANAGTFPCFAKSPTDSPIHSTAPQPLLRVEVESGHGCKDKHQSQDTTNPEVTVWSVPLRSRIGQRAQKVGSQEAFGVLIESYFWLEQW